MKPLAQELAERRWKRWCESDEAKPYWGHFVVMADHKVIDYDLSPSALRNRQMQEIRFVPTPEGKYVL